ncbi:MAG: Calx-beta domain-containing protein, partial [Rubripirellula sp.]
MSFHRPANSRKKSRRPKRPVSVERLEQRRLLAADVIDDVPSQIASFQVDKQDSSLGIDETNANGSFLAIDKRGRQLTLDDLSYQYHESALSDGDTFGREAQGEDTDGSGSWNSGSSGSWSWSSSGSSSGSGSSGSSGSSGGGGNNPQPDPVVKILDGRPEYGGDAGPVIEGQRVMFPVEGINLTGDVTVQVHTSPQSADTTDYVHTTVEVELTVDEPIAYVFVDTIDDPIHEPTEYFALNGVITDGDAEIESPGTGEIDDDDPQLKLISISDTTVNEGETASFDLELNFAYFEDVTVSFEVVDGTAEAGQPDYHAFCGSITFEEGTTSASVSVGTYDDFWHEDQETFYLNALTISEGIILDESGTGTIISDDPDIQIAEVNGTTVEEGEAVEFEIVLNEVTPHPVSFSYITSDLSAVFVEDYGSTFGSATIGPGSDRVTVTVPTIDESIEESDESFALTLSNVTHASGNGATGIGTILENDVPVRIHIEGPEDVDEGDSGQFRIFLDMGTVPTHNGISVQFETVDGTAFGVNVPVDENADYSPVTTTVSFAPGQIEQTVDVSSLHDFDLEPDEGLLGELSNIVGAAILGTSSAPMKIVNNDVHPVISINSASVTEGQALEFEVTLSSPVEQTVSVSYASSDMTAEAGTDYSAANGTVSFAPGETSTTITISTIDDVFPESNEAMKVVLSSPVYSTIGNATGVGTIEDDDEWAQLSIASTEAEEGLPLEFIASIDKPYSYDVSFSWNTEDITAMAGPDYAGNSGSSSSGSSQTASIPAGQTSTTISIETVNDADEEPTETMRLTLSDPSNAQLSNAYASGTIIDNDIEYLTSISGGGEIEEGNDWYGQYSDASPNLMEFVVTVSPQPLERGDTIIVSYAAVEAREINFDTEEQAAYEDDYRIRAPEYSESNPVYAAVGDLQFDAASGTSRTIIVEIHGDWDVEMTQRFGIELTGAIVSGVPSPGSGNVSIDTDYVDGTITDDDVPLVAEIEHRYESLKKCACTCTCSAGAEISPIWKNGSGSASVDPYGSIDLVNPYGPNRVEQWEIEGTADFYRVDLTVGGETLEPYFINSSEPSPTEPIGSSFGTIVEFGQGTGLYVGSVTLTAYRETNGGPIQQLDSVAQTVYFNVIDNRDSAGGAGWAPSGLMRAIPRVSAEGIKTYNVVALLRPDGTIWHNRTKEGTLENHDIPILPNGPNSLANEGVIEDPDGTRSKFDMIGNLLWQEDRNGNRTNYSYTDGNNDGEAKDLATVTTPLGDVTTYHYSGGTLDYIEDPNGLVWDYTVVNGKL